MPVSISVVIFRESWSYNFTYLNLGAGGRGGLRGILTLSSEPIISVLPYDDRQLERNSVFRDSKNKISRGGFVKKTAEDCSAFQRTTFSAQPLLHLRESIVPAWPGSFLISSATGTASAQRFYFEWRVYKKVGRDELPLPVDDVT